MKLLLPFLFFILLLPQSGFSQKRDSSGAKRFFLNYVPEGFWIHAKHPDSSTATNDFFARNIVKAGYLLHPNITVGLSGFYTRVRAENLNYRNGDFFGLGYFGRYSFNVVKDVLSFTTGSITTSFVPIIQFEHWLTNMHYHSETDIRMVKFNRHLFTPSVGFAIQIWKIRFDFVFHQDYYLQNNKLIPHWVRGPKPRVGYTFMF